MFTLIYQINNYRDINHIFLDELLKNIITISNSDINALKYYKYIRQIIIFIDLSYLNLIIIFHFIMSFITKEHQSNQNCFFFPSTLIIYLLKGLFRKFLLLLYNLKIRKNIFTALKKRIAVIDP